MLQLLIATTNPGKFREMVELLGQTAYSYLSLTDVQKTHPIPICPETGHTFTQNARIKANHYAHLSGLLTLADDSGLIVDALGGRPGLYSARFGPTDTARNNRILSELKGIPPSHRTARFICACAVASPMKGTIFISRGLVKGFITNKPIGDKNFGYDPIFYSKVLGKTFAQATTAEKNKISHRAKAVRTVRHYLISHLNTTSVLSDQK